jgi:predicted CXXCH cytochrome family protein
VRSIGGTRLADDPPARGIYWYRVSAVDASGSRGAPSSPVSSDAVLLSQRVGPRGGALEPTTGTVRLDIPPGAVQRPTTFTIRQLPSPPEPDAGHMLVTRVFDIEPDGTTFRPAATLTLRYSMPSAVGSGPSELPEDGTVDARFWDPAAGEWAGLRRDSVDRTRSMLSVRIPHLSVWAAGAFTLPHGSYSSDTDLCKTCHASHMAPGDSLLAMATERETCYSCHDGSGADSDVRSEFGEATLGTSTRTSFHPVPTPRDGIQLLCSDCHTPHKAPADDTLLLRVRSGNGYLYSPPDSPIGNAFCYACHGVDSALPAPFGDHSAFEDAVHNTDPGVPTAPSGSGIKCLACHASHGSDLPDLTTAREEDLCLACHTEAGFTAAANDYSTSDGTPVRIYHHPIATTDQDGGQRVVECASCHNPHVVTRSDAITDPANTASPWASDASSFCVLCHASPGTTQPISAGPTVPYTIRLVDDSGTDADGNVHDKFSASGWATSTHFEAGVACTECHDPHGSSNAYMLSEARGISGFNATGGDWQQLQTFCTSCHDALDPAHNPGTACTECHYHGSDEF